MLRSRTGTGHGKATSTPIWTGFPCMVWWYGVVVLWWCGGMRCGDNGRPGACPIAFPPYFFADPSLWGRFHAPQNGAINRSSALNITAAGADPGGAIIPDREDGCAGNFDIVLDFFSRMHACIGPMPRCTRRVMGALYGSPCMLGTPHTCLVLPCHGAWSVLSLPDR